MLGNEIDLVAEALGAPRPVSHIHFGGGLPNIVAADDFGRLLDRLRRRFALAPRAEIAVEIDLRGMTGERVDALARARRQARKRRFQGAPDGAAGEAPLAQTPLSFTHILRA